MTYSSCPDACVHQCVSWCVWLHTGRTAAHRPPCRSGGAESPVRPLHRPWAEV